jgi:hypothetical protein
MKVSFVRVSGNQKTGPIPTTMTEAASCPDACPLKGNGCYAEYGRTALHWKNMGSEKKFAAEAISWDEMCDNVSILRKGTLWRHNVAGDLPGDGDKIDTQKLSQLVEANARKGACGFTFTHKPVGYRGQELVNARAIYASNRSGFTVNLSADDKHEADELYDLGIGPVVCVLPEDAPQVSFTPKGRHVIVCPAEDKGLQCIDCQLCAKRDRKAIVGFRAHGAGKKKVAKRLKVLQ